MQVRDITVSEEGISGVSYELEKERFIIKWKWPSSCDIVYIFKSSILEEASIDEIEKKNLIVYTKDEYKEFNGYVENINEINQYRFIIFKAIEEEQITLVKQLDERNEIIVCTGKPNIIYEIIERKPLFSKNKTVKIKIDSDISIGKDVLCYVKKEGAYPLNKEDGVKFDFVSDFHVGLNEMPSIEINKNEYLKVFIKDIQKYGNLYSLRQK